MWEGVEGYFEKLIEKGLAEQGLELTELERKALATKLEDLKTTTIDFSGLGPEFMRKCVEALRVGVDAEIRDWDESVSALKEMGMNRKYLNVELNEYADTLMRNSTALVSTIVSEWYTRYFPRQNKLFKSKIGPSSFFRKLFG